MKKAIFLLLILGASLSVFGQQRSTLRGKVVDDEDGSPLFGATVVVDSLKNGMVDESGAFTVTDIPRGEALVEVYSLGYVTVTQTVNFDQATIDLGTIRMKEDANAIEEVVVTAAANPVIQRGDTTQFNAEAFKTNPDAYAADLLAKMPGMEVTSSGVTAQGEAVARVYVNDELLFGDDAMSALSNLSADMVESIQMFDELPDEARFSGFNDGQTQRALNIVTKGAIEKVIDARVSGGYGQELQRDIDGKYQPRYDIGGQMSYIASGTMFNLNGILNNLNQNQFGGGRFSGRGGRGGGGLQTIKNLGGAYTATWNETSTLNLTYNYFGNDTKQNSKNIRDYYPVQGLFDTRIERDTTASSRGNDNHSGSLRYEYEGTKDRVMVMANGSLGSNDSESFSINEDNRNGSPYSATTQNSASNGSNYSVRANVNWSHKLGEKAGRTFSLQANVNLSNNDSEQVSISDVTKYYEDETDSRIYLNTNSNSFSRNFGANIDYNEPLSDKLRLNFRYSPSYNYSSTEKLITDEFGTLDEAVSERFTYDYFTQRGRIGLSYNEADKFNFTVSVNGQISSQAKTISLPKRDDPNFERDFTSILPTLSVRYYVNRTKYFNLNYNANSSMPSLERLSTVVDVSNPLRYTSGNPNLKQSYGHSLNLRYNANNIERLTNFSAGIRASLTQNSVQNKTTYFTEATYIPEYDYTFDAGTQLVTPVNVDGSVSLGANANYGFVFRPLKLNINLGGNYNYSRSPSYVGEDLTVSNNNRMGFNLSINSNISENVDFTVSSNTSYGYTKYSTGNVDNRETISQSVGAYLTYIFLGGFVFSTDFSYNYQNTLDAPFSVWNAYIGRKFLRDNSAEFRIEFNDILNQSRNYSYSYGTTYDTQSWSRVIGRYVIAKVTYRFNNMKNQASQYGPQGGFPGSGAIPGSGMMPGGMPAGGGMRGGMPGGGAPMMGPGRF